MSDEQRKDEEVEGHALPPKYGANDEAGDDEENDFEAHVMKFPNVRMD